MEFYPNHNFSDLSRVHKSTIGIHTMWNVHFRIGDQTHYLAYSWPADLPTGQGPLMDVIVEDVRARNGLQEGEL